MNKWLQFCDKYWFIRFIWPLGTNSIWQLTKRRKPYRKMKNPHWKNWLAPICLAFGNIDALENGDILQNGAIGFFFVCISSCLFCAFALLIQSSLSQCNQSFHWNSNDFFFPLLFHLNLNYVQQIGKYAGFLKQKPILLEWLLKFQTTIKK